MTTKLAGSMTALALAAGLSATPGSLYAQGDKTAAATVAGNWTMSVESPHGVTSMGLVLKQDGKKVTGTFATPHGDMSVEGEFADRTLTLATMSGGGDSAAITFKAKLKDDGTLAGSLSSAMGDMTWTAKRVKDDR